MFRAEHEARLKGFLKRLHEAEEEFSFQLLVGNDGSAIVEDSTGLFGEVELEVLLFKEYEE